MRYLGPAALTAASLVLLLATDGALLNPATALRPAATGTAATDAAAAGEATAGGPAGTELAAAVAPAAPAGPAPTPPPPPRTVLPDPKGRREALPRALYSGPGFDACTAPALEAMQAWWNSSPYGALGIYSSGDHRACTQPRLTADWVRRVRAMGWKLLPTHVGPQAPCRTAAGRPRRIDPATAVQQGRDEAATAVRALKALGLAAGTPVYLDIESYPRGDAACSQAVVEFAMGWTQALHTSGYHAGFYSSTDSGIADLAAAARAGSSPLPDAVWFARWNDRADTADTSGTLDGLWADRRRVHQYRGNTQETYGGATLTIDRDHLDTLVAR